MRIAVTGATGFIGSAVVRRQLGNGDHIRALVRPGPRLSEPTSVDLDHANVELVRGDLGDPAMGPRFLAGVDALVHLALDRQKGRYRGGEGDDPVGFVLTNLSATLALLRSAIEARVPRVIFVSSRAVFDGCDVRLPATIADDARPSPTTLYGACKAAVESLVTTAGSSYGGGDHSVLCGIRPTGVYGMASPPESTKWWAMVETVANQQPVQSDGGGTEVHVNDVAHGIQVLLTAGAADVSARMFNCSDVYVPHRAIASLAAGWFGNPGARCQEPANRYRDPPAPEPDVRNVLDSSALRALGVSFRGWEGVRNFTDDLCAAVVHNMSGPRQPERPGSGHRGETRGT
jgi:nucleoside-diphosphate-sugar epimerase